MPGGAAAIKQPWRMAAAYLGTSAVDLDVFRRNASQWPAVLSMAETATNSPWTSSAGRLFDAVAALLGLRDRINYEGQAAIELEQLADVSHTSAYSASITDSAISGADLVAACAHDLRAGVPRPLIAARFHNGVAEVITRACVTFADQTGVDTVALSGGVFQNLLLLDRTVTALEASGLRVLTHSRVPTNDGGISLGQAVIAAQTCTTPTGTCNTAT
jgi:hydrogenase maturation protein HypF